MRTNDYNPLQLRVANIDSMSLKLVRPGSKVLELGCSSGYLGALMESKFDCNVIGVELDRKAARIARRRISKVITGNVEDAQIYRKIKQAGPYDIIFASAILEHLVAPDKFLQFLKPQLRQNGYFIITLPNITHWTARLKILRGRFDYEQAGLFDSTHLHFYSLKTATALLTQNDLIINHIQYEYFGPRFLTPFFSYLPNLFAYQFLFRAGIDQ